MSPKPIEEIQKGNSIKEKKKEFVKNPLNCTTGHLYISQYVNLKRRRNNGKQKHEVRWQGKVQIQSAHDECDQVKFPY